jgi:hypothetical protein
MPGKGKLVLTGQLGDVMKESAQTALAWIRSNAALCQIDGKPILEGHDIHIHFPAGFVSSSLFVNLLVWRQTSQSDQTDRQTDRLTDRQTDRQTDRPKEGTLCITLAPLTASHQKKYASR